LRQKIGVVIVDDSSQWLHHLESAVAEIDGLTVIGSASRPSAAVELVSRLRPPITILDLFLSGGSGIEVLKALASQGVHTQVVVVTGSPCARLREACLELGARYFFDKAFELEELVAALRTLRDEEIGREVRPNQ
jgi:DNA-binding NarL/FixJ family response regulator